MRAMEHATDNTFCAAPIWPPNVASLPWSLFVHAAPSLAYNTKFAQNFVHTVSRYM